MQVTSTELFLIAMAIIYSVPWLVWRLGRTEYFAPLVVVQIIMGILLGPGVLGAAFPDQFRFVFTTEVVQALNGVATWAVMLFVWIAGIELNLGLAWKNRVETATTAGLALLCPLLLGSLVAIAMLAHGPGWIGSAAAPWQFVIGIGMACTVTALPILILFMEKLAILRRPLGQRVLRYASLDDIAVWGVLAMVLVDLERLGRQASFLAAFALGALAVRALMRRLAERDRWFVGPIWLIFCALAADWSGLHFMVGAFLAGVVLDSDWYDQAHMDLLRQHVLLVLMPVFFLSTGLRTEWSVGGTAVFMAAALLLVAAVGGKLAGTLAAGRLLGWRPGEASLIGWLLQTKALIMIIFANILLDKAIITAETFTALLLMAVASTMLTIPMATPRLQAMDSEPESGAREPGRPG